MSLNEIERANTINELNVNFQLLHYSLTKIAQDLHTEPSRIQDILKLNHVMPEDAWILKNYLSRELFRQGKEEIAYTKLTGTYRDYWFLDQQIIEQNKIL
ncbi:DUF2316 family protein [Leuconostoc sp. JNUCC 76]